jgi:predicted metal-dependent phosphoesterase TrpH
MAASCFGCTNEATFPVTKTSASNCVAMAVTIGSVIVPVVRRKRIAGYHMSRRIDIKYLMLSCDLHIHTTYSRDGESDIQTILNVAQERGLNAIAITDHDEILGAQEAIHMARTLTPDLLIIPGIEVSTREGHLIVLGITEVIERDLPARTTIKYAHEMNGLVIAPHPFHRYRHGVGRRDSQILLEVDAIEVFNSRYIVGVVGSDNNRAHRFAEKYHISKVAGSDAHQARHIGYGTTLIDAEKNIPSILAAIQAGKTQIDGKKTPLSTYARQSMKNSWRKVKSIPIRRVLKKGTKYRFRKL